MNEIYVVRHQYSSPSSRPSYMAHGPELVIKLFRRQRAHIMIWNDWTDAYYT